MAALGSAERGIHIVGDIPAGLPSIGFGVWPDGIPLTEMIVGALAVTIVAYAESLATAQPYARKYGVIAAIVTVITILFLTALFLDLPEAT